MTLSQKQIALDKAKAGVSGDLGPSCDGNDPLILRKEQIYGFWDELCDIGVADINRALEFCNQTLCDWLGAQNAFWIGAVRLPDKVQAVESQLDGWQIGAIEVLHDKYTSIKRLNHVPRELRAQDPGETTRVVMSAAGRFRVYSLGSGIVDLEQFRETAHYDYFYRKPGIVDRIWVAFPVHEGGESLFVFDRFQGDRFFSEAELRLAAEALRGIKWFHRNLLLSRGLGPNCSPLTPAERRMLPHLLSGATEKVISDRLELTPATVHQYVTEIYRKFGVRGRINFMALWSAGVA